MLPKHRLKTIVVSDRASGDRVRAATNNSVPVWPLAFLKSRSTSQVPPPAFSTPIRHAAAMLEVRPDVDATDEARLLLQQLPRELFSTQLMMESEADALAFRESKGNAYVPTIVARDGFKLESSGIYGGSVKVSTTLDEHVCFRVASSSASAHVSESSTVTLQASSPPPQPPVPTTATEATRLSEERPLILETPSDRLKELAGGEIDLEKWADASEALVLEPRHASVRSTTAAREEGVHKPPVSVDFGWHATRGADRNCDLNGVCYSYAHRCSNLMAPPAPSVADGTMSSLHPGWVVCKRTNSRWSPLGRAQLQGRRS